MRSRAHDDARALMREMARLCVAHRVKRAARAVSRRYDAILDDVGLTSSQLTLLSAIELRPELHQRGLADVLAMEPSALSRALAALKRRGLVTTTSGDDRRAHRLALTARGRHLVVVASSRWREAQREAHALIDNEHALFAALDRLAALGASSSEDEATRARAASRHETSHAPRRSSRGEAR